MFRDSTVQGEASATRRARAAALLPASRLK